ncbi:MAG: hypothetical protein CHACPFDD_00798 [Phycisphaerae bacterium]|nr:hypothetical protein [Phycisphaerae bacterium]
MRCSLLASISEEQRQALEFAGLPSGWARLVGLLALAVVCYVVVWLYRREGRGGASARVRALLAGVRCLTLMLLAIVWLRPVLATYVIQTITAQVAVLVDASSSMGVSNVVRTPESAAAASSPAVANAPHGAEADSGRARIERLLSAHDHRWLARLAERNQLAVYAFGRRTAELAPPASIATVTNSADALPASAAGGLVPYDRLPADLTQATDLGQALAEAYDRAADSPIAAMIVLSDGQFNHGMGPEELLAYARRNKLLLHCVGVGPAEEPPNLRITSLAAPAAVARGDPFEVRVELAADGIESTNVSVELRSRRIDNGVPAAPAGSQPADAGEGVLAGTRNVEIVPGQPIAPLVFPLSPETPGEYVYEAIVSAAPGEAVTHDNRRATSLVVIDHRIRVLMVAGRPSYEYRAIMRLLIRDQTIDVSTWLQSADQRAIRDGDTPLTELPRLPQDLFAYDVIMLVDPASGDLDSSWAVNVRRWVDEFAGGVIVVAGHQFTARFLNDPVMSDLVAVLPVTPDPEAAVRMSETGSYRAHAFPLAVPPENRSHPLVLLDDDVERSAQLWNALPGVISAVPVLRAKPVAATLLVEQNPASRNQYGDAVIFAAQQVGAGRTAYLGIDSTWRWRALAENQFNRFWIQAVRYLAQPRRQTGSRRGVIVLEQDRPIVGEPFKLEAHVLDESFSPWQEPQVAAEFALPDGTVLNPVLRAIPGREGWFEGRLSSPMEGVATVRIPLPGSSAAHEQLSRRVHVQRVDIEMRALRQRVDTLTRIATETGGYYVPIEAAESLPDRIEKASQTRVTRGPDRDLWDRSWVLIVISVLLTAEWAIRRRTHLL